MYLEQSGEIGRKLEQILGGSENFEFVRQEIFLRGQRGMVYYWDGYWPEDVVRTVFSRLQRHGDTILRRAKVCADSQRAVCNLWRGGFLVITESDGRMFLLRPEETAGSSLFSSGNRRRKYNHRSMTRPVTEIIGRKTWFSPWPIDSGRESR